MQEEVTQKTMAFSIKSAKLTAQVLQAAARKFLETQNKGKTKLHHGQQSLKQLKKHGAALSNIEITDANIGLFRPCAKKYGVDFTLRKDATTQPPHPSGRVGLMADDPRDGPLPRITIGDIQLVVTRRPLAVELSCQGGQGGDLWLRERQARPVQPRRVSIGSGPAPARPGPART